MNLTIHRGTREIGGTCIELEQDGTRIVLDLGIPLVTSDGTRFDQRSCASMSGPELVKQGILPAVPGLYPWDSSPPVTALLVSHPHLDHYGFAHFARQEIPVYLGAGGHRMVQVSARFLSHPAPAGAVRHYVSGQRFTVGSFTITPYLMDHSAFDAHAFVIEGGGRTVIYTGDFRDHGRKRRAFEFFLKHAPRHADALLMEGSIIGRSGDQITEEDVTRGMTEVLRGTKGISYFVGSAQNIDRLVSLYKACRRANRTLVIDLYTASVLRELAGLSAVMHPSRKFADLKVSFFPVKLRNKVLPEHLQEFQRQAVRRDDLVRDPGRYCQLLRTNMIPYLDRFPELDGGTLIYSMWNGYLSEGCMRPLMEFSTRHGLAWHNLHSSGHATVETLRRTVTVLSPRRMIPVHTFYPQAYQELFPDAMVTRLSDGIPTTI